VEIGVARGKQLHDKRDSIAERESERNLRRVLKGDWQ
jgi:tmRNA-binding protein